MDKQKPLKKFLDSTGDESNLSSSQADDNISSISFNCNKAVTSTPIQNERNSQIDLFSGLSNQSMSQTHNLDNSISQFLPSNVLFMNSQELSADVQQNPMNQNLISESQALEKDSRFQSLQNSTTANNSNLIQSPMNKRNKNYIRNISSASLKKRKNKNSHCKYCNLNKSKKDLEQHLIMHATCAELYMREFKVQSIMSVLLKIFPCFNCSITGTFRLKRHLDENKNCFDAYKNKFGVNNTDELSQKIKYLKSQSCPSRQRVQRKLTYHENKSYSQDSKTVTQAINDFKRSIALANYRLCCKCSGNFLECSTVEISSNHIFYTSLQLNEKPEMKRMNKFYACKVCLSSNQSQNNTMSPACLNKIELNGKTILYPMEHSNPNLTPDAEINSKCLILIPKNMNFKQKIQKIQININKCDQVTNSYMSTIYKNQVSKFIQKKLIADRFEGTIENQETRTVSNIKPIMDDSDIRLSETWISSKITGLQARFQQFGANAIAFSIKINFNTPETVATGMLIEGSVVTLEFQGNQSYDFETKYFLHKHNLEDDCTNNCEKLELTESIIKKLPKLRCKYVSIFISSIYQKMQGIVNNLIKNPNCSIAADEYYVGVKFDLEGNAIIEGLLWTGACDDLNKTLSTSSLTGEPISYQHYLNYISSTVMTTSDKNELKLVLNITEEEAISLSKLVKKYQLETNNQPISDLKLPSLDYFLTVRPDEDSLSNLSVSEKLFNAFQKLLHKTSVDDKVEQSTLQWLDKIKSNFNIEMETHNLSLKTDAETFSLLRDDRLNTLIAEFDEFLGIYHYVLTCNNVENMVILKRIQLIECYTTPYNPILLKAFDQRVDVLPVTSFHQWDIFQEKYSDTMPNIQSNEINTMLSNHRIVNILELISISDCSKIKDIQSSSIEFISTYMQVKNKFKKAVITDEETYSTETKEIYNQLSSCTLRHESRRNGLELILAETALFYEPLNKKESKELIELYGDQINKIPLSEVESIYGEQKMPKFILSGKDQALRIRLKKKVLEIPHFTQGSDEFKYSRILLYFPRLPNTSIDTNRLGKNLKQIIINL